MVPIPSSAGDTVTQEFLDDIKTIVIATIDAVRHDVQAAQRDSAETAVFASEAQAHSSIESPVI